MLHEAFLTLQMSLKLLHHQQRYDFILLAITRKQIESCFYQFSSTSSGPGASQRPRPTFLSFTAQRGMLPSLATHSLVPTVSTEHRDVLER